MNLKLLAEPFKEEEIEFRLSQCGKKGNGQIWAMCLVYIQARAIMDRLDDVCGPENWRVSYSFPLSTGVLCHLSVKINNEWITKEDGSDQTDIEAFKGGISGALKRAAVPWGIGRYLYRLDSAFADIVDEKHPQKRYGKTKEGTTFYWAAPRLPAWALPTEEKNKAGVYVHPEQPKSGDGVTHNNKVFKTGRASQKTPESCTSEVLTEIVEGHILKFSSELKMPENVKYDYKLAMNELSIRGKNKTKAIEGDFDFEDAP